MNVRKLSQAINARVLMSVPLSSGSLSIFAIVEDVRKVYDRVDLLVRPESGEGAGWVSLTRLKHTPEGVCDFSVAQLTA